jgi:hypothetical protein
MSFADLTLKQLAELGSLNGPAARAARRLLVTSYSEFLEVLYEDLDESLKYIIQTRELRKNEGEDRTTADIIGQLLGRNYDAKHDEKHGGHCDIVVSHPSGYLWMAECKIHGAYDYLKQGFDQLCTRYMSGISNADHGSLIVFVYNKDAKSVVEEWRQRLGQHGYGEYADADCPNWKELGFVTTHRSVGAGRLLKIRHTSLPLHFAPAA